MDMITLGGRNPALQGRRRPERLRRLYSPIRWAPIFASGTRLLCLLP